MHPNSTMFINNGDARRRNSSKTKMKEMSANLHNDDCHHRLLFPFKSFTALLTEPDEEEEEEEEDSQSLHGQIDQIISFHCDILKRSLAGALDREAENRAAKKMKEEGSSALQEMLNEHAELAEEARRLRDRVRQLEDVKEALRRDLRDAIAARRYAETPQEDTESSFVDPDRVEAVRLECMACRRRTATVMVWPCRHVCLCTSCDPGARSCPVCRRVKSAGVEIRLPA